MVVLPIYDKKGKETGKMELPEEIFSKKVNGDIIHQAVVMYQAGQRQGTVNTKERADVHGGGRKPYRQKGTGRARQGSIRAPQFIGGGVVFGPHPRDFGYTLPKKIRKSALKESLNAKVQGGQVVFIDEFKEAITKTKDFATILKVLKVNGKTLGLLEGCDETVRLSSRNIPRFEIVRAEDVNAYDIMRNKFLVLTRSAYEILEKRINVK